MKKHAIFGIILASALISANAVEVNESEIRSAGNEDVIQFENYMGPHKVIDSLDAIKAIGRNLGQDVKQDLENYGAYKTSEKYSVIHAVDPTSTDKLDADIIFINDNATVDHIKNLRHIIAAYLSETYGYSESDATTVATFVTVYNAVYRGKFDVFESKYKDIVTKNLSETKCGLSTKWSEWPGNSEIVIPLNEITGGLSAVDTSVISDKEVVNSMQEEDDKGVDERKNMVDIKEREAEAATEKAQQAAQKSAEESKKLTEENKKLEDQKKAQAEADKKATETKKAADVDPANKQKQQAAEEAKKEAEKQAQKTEEQQQKTDEQKTVAEEAKKEAQEQQEIADTKQTEAQNERTQIAKDQQKLLEQALAEQAKQNVAIGLNVTDPATNLATMVKVDAETGDVIRTSPVTVIRGRTMLPAGTYSDISDEVEQDTAMLNIEDSVLYMAICGTTAGNQDVRLCLLDAYKMEIQKQGEESVSPNSVLVQDGEDYYCVIKEDKNFVIAKYNKTLKLQLKGSTPLSSATAITVTPKGIIVTDATGLPLLLNLKDLEPIVNQATIDKINLEK